MFLKLGGRSEMYDGKNIRVLYLEVYRDLTLCMRISAQNNNSVMVSS